MSYKFTPGTFFDFSKVSFGDLFGNVKFTWEILPLIEEYILIKFKTKKIVSNYKKNKNVFVGKNSFVAKGALIKGPAIIGKNCYIEEGCLIRENCIIGDNVHIGHGVEVKNSAVLNNTAIAHLNYVGDSIIGSNVNISGGAIIANFRLDKHTVLVNTGKEKIDTGLEKFGAVIGDGTVIGVNSVINPGTILGKNCVVYPLTSVSGIYKDKEKIKK